MSGFIIFLEELFKFGDKKCITRNGPEKIPKLKVQLPGIARNRPKSPDTLKNINLTLYKINSIF
jgi:hypothetical protein